MAALAGIGAKTPNVKARAGRILTVLFSCHVFMAQM
jgi:hypothetical protein